MAQAEAGLELPIGVTEQKFAQQLARIEARAIKAANSMEKGFVKSNAAITRSTQGMSGAVRGQISNVSFQMQDLAVQIGAGTSAAQALGQQLPQLLGGFGALGAVLGAVVAIGIPLAAAMFGAGDSAKELAKSIEALEDSVKNYQQAVENSNITTAELAAKYGIAAESAGALFDQMARLAKLEAIGTLRESVNALKEDFSGLSALVETVNAEQSLGLGDSGLVAGSISKLKEEYGLTIEQAQRLNELLDAMGSAQGPQQIAAAMTDVSRFIDDATGASGEMKGRMLEAAKSVAQGALAALELAEATQDAEDAARGLSGAASSVSFDGAIASANGLTAALRAAVSQAAALSANGVFIGSDGTVNTGARGRDPSTDWRFQDPNRDYDTLKERRAREAAADARSARTAGGGGGSRKRSGGGGGGRAAKEPTDIFANAAQEIANLERQITLIGKSTEETARLQAQWELLDAAKKAGVPVNDELNARISAQADQVGRLTAELERGELAQQQFDQAVEGIANSFSNAILEGENLRDSLASIFKQIAANILNAGIQNALTQAFSGAGTGGGVLGSILGAAFGGTKAAVPSFDGGGYTWNGPRSGGLDGKGGRLAMLHPNETVLDHSRGQGRAVNFAPSTNITVQGSMDDRTMTQLRRELDMRDARLARQMPGIMSEHSKRRG